MALTEDKVDYMFEAINLNSMCREIASEYVLPNFGDYYNINDAMKTIKYLLLEKKYTKEQIMAGLADNYLLYKGRELKMLAKSVYQENEMEEAIKLKTGNKKIPGEKLKRAFILIGGLALTTSILGVVSADRMSDVTINDAKKNIASMEFMAMNEQSQGNYIPYNELMANNIISLCVKDPTLFDVFVYDAYYKLSNDRLDNFNDIWGKMQQYMQLDEAYNVFYSKLANKTFLNYVLEFLARNGKVVHYLKDYQIYSDVINEYDKDPVFNHLSKESQHLIVKMMDIYKEMGRDLYKENKNNISNLMASQNDEFGGRK